MTGIMGGVASARWSLRLRFVAALIAGSCLHWTLGIGGDGAKAQDADRGPQILMLFSNESTQPASEAIARGFRAAFDAALPDRRRFFTEFLDFNRFPEPEHEARMLAYLRDKYASIRIDLVVAVGPAALKFLAGRQGSLFQAAPIVFVGVGDADPKGWDVPANVTGVLSSFDTVRTIDLALALQPDAKTLVVVTGRPPSTGNGNISLAKNSASWKGV